MMRTCKVEGCNKKHWGKGLCSMHYSRMRKHGSLELPAGYKRHSHPENCTFPGCNKPYTARGLCNAHYYAAKWSGEFGFSPCKVEGCKNSVYSKNLCRNHYALARRNGRPEKKAHLCKYPGCTKNTRNNYCHPHFLKVSARLKAGLPLSATHHELFSGSRVPSWNGGVAEYPNHSEFKRQRKIKLKSVNYICEECGGHATECHHKDKTKFRHEQDNLIALCHKCHLGIYHKGSTAKPRTDYCNYTKVYGLSSMEISKTLNISYCSVRRYHRLGTLSARLSGEAQG